MSSTVYLDPKIWGPHYWFFLHTVAMTYPHHPNAVTKKKYYEFIQNLPLFIPVEQISKEFEKIIDIYPITPYLDNRDSFVRWTHFIHNKINEKLEKPPISLNDFFVQYYNQYKSQNEKLAEHYKLREKFMYGGILVAILYLIYYLYDK
jgi:pyruvate-formate lyase-activating enzyme